ncbi:MAG: hypothetical protein R6U61_02110 [Thermoplasmata archaeon]
MDAKTAVFSTVSIKSHTIKELIDKLPYSSDMVYRVVGELEKEGLLVKTRKGKEVLLRVSDDYKSQILREIHIKALSYGIDPEVLLRDSTIMVWKALGEAKFVEDIQQHVDLSKKWIRKILNFLERSDLVHFKKKRPIVAVKKEEHKLNDLLDTHFSKVNKSEDVYQPGRFSFEKRYEVPKEIEKELYEKIDSGLTVQDTDYLVRGEKMNILESVPEEPSIEEIFIRELETVEGVEDFCIRLIKSNQMDYEKLLELAKEEGKVNIVGCYLDILGDIGVTIDPEEISMFEENVKDRKMIFLEEEKKYGKNDWEKKYEKKWNVDLYLDIGAIRHGVRGA